jgi:ankyrin repeat protein
MSSLALLSATDQAGESGPKIVKRLAFALLTGFALMAVPAAAQNLTTPSHDFIEAVKKADGDKAISALSSHPEGLVNTRDDDGDTGLIISIKRSDETWTGFLLNKGADPNLAGQNGDTPLIAAARVGFEQAMEWLVTLGARVDEANRMGETPLIIAVQQREPQVVKFLLQHGADPDKTDHAAGYSARDYATRDTRAREILKMIDDAKPKSGATAAK